MPREARLLLTLERYKETCGYSIYAYCLMDNHFHILIKEEREPLAQIIKNMVPGNMVPGTKVIKLCWLLKGLYYFAHWGQVC